MEHDWHLLDQTEHKRHLECLCCKDVIELGDMDPIVPRDSISGKCPGVELPQAPQTD